MFQVIAYIGFNRAINSVSKSKRGQKILPHEIARIQITEHFSKATGMNRPLRKTLS